MNLIDIKESIMHFGNKIRKTRFNPINTSRFNLEE